MHFLPHVRINPKYYGFTLMEILIANALCSLLILLFIMCFNFCLRTNLELKGMANDLENCRFACYFIRQKLSAAYRVEQITLQEKSMLRAISNDAIKFYLIKDKAIPYFLYLAQSNTSGSKSPLSLYFKELNKPRVEIAEGITQLKILYGIKCPKALNICQYLLAKQVNDWTQVSSLNLSLLGSLWVKPWGNYIALKQK
jgi:hypothetical protein